MLLCKYIKYIILIIPKSFKGKRNKMKEDSEEIKRVENLMGLSWFCKNLLFIFLILELGIFGCSEKKENYSTQDVWAMVVDEDPDIMLILPEKDYPAIDCKVYGKGCMYGHTAKTKGLVFHLIRFETELDAKVAGRKIAGPN